VGERRRRLVWRFLRAIVRALVSVFEEKDDERKR